MYGRCKRCGKRLTDPESRLRGFGPDCWGEIIAKIRLSDTEDENAQIPGQISLFDLLDMDEPENGPGQKK